MEETWFAFDGPRLFVARSQTGQAFLFNATDEDDTTIWYLAVAVSERRREMLRSGGLALRAAFVSPEDGFVFRIQADYETALADFEVVAVEQLGDDELPTEGAVISQPTETLPSFDPASLGQRATAEGRTLLALRLNPPSLVRSEYPARPLSDALRVVQALAEALVQEASGEPTRRGPLPVQVVEDAELAVLDLEAASFVAILAPSRSARSTPSAPSLGLEMPGTLAALERLQGLMNSCANADELRTDVSTLGVRSVTKIRDLLEIALDQNTSLTTYLAVPGSPVQEVTVTTAQASSGVLVLSERDELLETIELTQATLVGINLRTWVFELHDPNVEPFKFSGRVADQAKAEVEGKPTGEAHRYHATLLKETVFSDLTDETKVKYSLQSIRPAAVGDDPGDNAIP
jgi:hypothetical protein